MIYDARTPDRSLSFALAFIGGYGDAVSFVLAKTFTGHITGSLVLGAIAIAARDWRATLARFLAVVCYGPRLSWERAWEPRSLSSLEHLPCWEARCF
jgi:hypothetical protein